MLPLTSCRNDAGTVMLRCVSCRYIYRFNEPQRPYEPDDDLRVAMPAIPDDDITDELLGIHLTIVEQAVGRGTLLDINCGNGQFLRLARRNGWRVMGIEPRGGSTCDGADGIVIIRHLEEGHWPAGSCDAVTLWQGMEWTASPDRLLATAAHYCRLDGILAVHVHNGEQQDTHGYDADTQRLFTPVALHRYLARFGFRTERIRHTAPTSRRHHTTDDWLTVVARYVP